MLGLTLEGGASRTVYSCGILDALLEENIMPDYFLGVSAGIAFGVSYISKQKGRNLALATDYMPKREYMGLHHLINPKTRCFYNMDYVYREVPNELLPFDYDAYAHFKGRVVACVTNVDTGKAEYLDCPRDDKNNMLLRASCALPLMFPEIAINGQKYLDGGIADSIPYKQAIKEGCDKNIVILTRPRDYIKRDEPATKLALKYYRKHPELCEAMKTRAERYNQCVSELDELRKQGKAFVFTPKTTFGVQRTENNPVRLKQLYEHGYKHAKWAMESLKEYLAK